MAAYGPNGGVVPFTGFSPTLGVGDATTPGTTGQVQFNGMTQSDNELSQVLWTRANRAVRKLLLTVLGVAPGATATENYKRVLATQALVDPMQLGGLVNIESVNQVNRATTAADVTNLTAVVSRGPSIVFVADVSGNGGGSKLGF